MISFSALLWDEDPMTVCFKVMVGLNYGSSMCVGAVRFSLSLIHQLTLFGRGLRTLACWRLSRVASKPEPTPRNHLHCMPLMTLVYGVSQNIRDGPYLTLRAKTVAAMLVVCRSTFFPTTATERGFLRYFTVCAVFTSRHVLGLRRMQGCSA